MTKLINNLNIFVLLIGMLVFIGLPFNASANAPNEENPTATIKGTVTSETGEPVIGASVAVKDGANGTFTDAAGAYTIEADPTATLVFSYIGFETQEIIIDSRSTIDVVMIENAELVDEVVVVGYGTQKKSHLTGSISKVTNENLDQIPMARVDDALVGQVAGVNIQMTNPAAGEAPTIRVRGQGSISFDSDPLIVVDGIAVGTDADFLASLDMNDVESIEILKDAASAAIYGSRGANGIVMITTKDGKEGPVQLSYDSYVGFKSVPANDYLTTISDWSAFVRANNDGNLTDEMTLIEQLGTYTDWQDVMMDGGMIQSHALSARGGTKNTKYRISASYLNDEGVLLTDNYEKLNFRLNLSTKINDRITFGTTMNPSHIEQRRFPIGVHDAVRQHAWLPLYLDENNIDFVNRYRENGRWADVQIGDYAMERMFDDYDLVAGAPDDGDGGTPSGTDISGTSNQSSLAKVLERDRRKFQTKIYANTFLKIKLAKGLTFKQVVGGDFRTTRNTRWAGVEASRNGAGDSESTLSTNNRFHSVFESTLNYKKEYGEHSLNAVVGYAYEKWNFTESQIEAAGFTNDYIQTIPAANLVGAFTERYEEALLSYLGRVNYVYADKYLVSISARRDGSSKFGVNNRYGFFPAVSVGWNIANEKFLQDVELIDQFKIRASYGNSGSNFGTGRNPYAHLGLVSPIGTGISGVGTGFQPDNIGNPELRWEKLRETNIGLDIAILEGRVSASVDVYNRTSEDLLLALPIPAITGFESAIVNRGEVSNSGFELELRTKNVTSEDFTWSTTAMLTRNVNTLVDFAGSSGLISTVDSKRPAEWVALEGQPIASYYGYVVDREIPLEYINNPFYPVNAQSQDVYVKDLNGDGLIDTDDRTILGSPYPDFIWTINNTIRFKDFDLSFMFQGSEGGEIRNISSQYIKQEFSSKQDHTSDLPDAGFVQQRIFTNDDIQDASFIALRNLNLGYTLSNSLKGIKRLRVYVGAQNLLYIMAEGYEGWNPEGIDQGLGNPLTWGYQRGPAPIYRTVSFGLNLTI